MGAQSSFAKYTKASGATRKVSINVLSYFEQMQRVIETKLFSCIDIKEINESCGIKTSSVTFPQSLTIC